MITFFPLTKMYKWTPTILLLITFFLFYQYIRSHSYRDPGSIFFDASRAYQTKYSKYRLKEIKDTKIVKGASTLDASVCAIFSSYKRPIEVTIQSALAGLHPQERQDLHLAVLFAHADPTIHPSWGIEVDAAISYKSGALKDIKKLAEYEAKDDYFHKGAEDYAIALEYCMNTTLPWAAVFEDDVLFAEGWFARLKHALLQPDEDLESLLYLRMFNDERATGWAGRGLLANNELYISAVSNAIAFGLLWRKPWSMILPVLVFIPSVITLFFAAGKATMLPPRPGVREENFGCCSQALIYPRHQLQPLLTYLRNAGSGQVDLLINDFGQENGLRRKSIYPVMVQHRGATIGSVRGTTAKDAQQIWSMAFEELDPRQLQKQHDELVAQIWPLRATD